MDWGGVRERVEALARTDRARRIFGAWDEYGAIGHHFRLAAPLSEPQVGEVEEQWGISLPADYRGFLLEVGAGGAGPGYGLNVVARQGAGWRWQAHDRMRHDRLRVPSPSAALSERMQAEHAGREPVEAEFEDEDAFLEANRIWLEEDEAVFEWTTCGAVNLCHEGCGYCYWLIVSGPERGSMWLDERPGDGTFSPLGEPQSRVSFAAWYLNWLETSESSAAVRR